MRNTILFADNDQDSRISWERILRNAGYDVRLASGPEEARHVLHEMGVDVAVLDLRLVDDTDEHDISGLLIAKERAYRHIPKIILTAFQTGYRNLRETLGCATASKAKLLGSICSFHFGLHDHFCGYRYWICLAQSVGHRNSGHSRRNRRSSSQLSLL